MPTILTSGPYRFFFYSNERGEPAHVHVERDTAEAKFWLDPVSLASNHGFAAHELNTITTLVEKHREEIREAWNNHFGTDDRTAS